ncbi:MAG: DNA polymerase III subunit gamma/tau [Deltaproteobacteria bacterium]|nr:DNA polymerase III subunit gamma/tau [Deltaproteobacteria bacterium]
MAYQALARKYRPETFNDLIGQEAVARALANAIKLGREPAGIIFSGVRGIGKTTSARLFAKALNCDSGPSPTPCNSCYSCKAISGGYHEDVLEVDGASHNSVAEVRALQETLGYTAQRSRYKIYIIDEVHMLSNSAFNALLKTLEEPPANIIFMFATTELAKVPKTVQSRCQTFHLKKVIAQDIQARLRYILDQEKIPYDTATLPLIAREGNGSIRDALTFLDQVIAFGDGNVSKEALEKLSTCVSSSHYIEILSALLDKKANECLSLIASLDKQGVDYEDVSNELARYLRHAIVLGTGTSDDASSELNEEEKASLLALNTKSRGSAPHQLFRCLLDCHHELDGTWLDRFVLENYSLEWCLQEPLSKHEALPSPPERAPKSASFSPPPRRDTSPPPAPPPTAFPSNWSELVARMKQDRPVLGRKLEEVHILSYSEQLISVAADPTGFAGAELLRPDVRKKFEGLFREFFKFTGTFQVNDRTQLQVQKQELPIQESLLERRNREQEERRKKIEEDARNNPLTKAFVEELGGNIEKIDVNF